MSKGARIGWPFGILLSGVLLLGQAQAAMYKWVDENGVTQYSQYPPKDKPVEVMVPPPSPAKDRNGAHQKLEQTLQQLDEKAEKRDDAAAEQAASAAEVERRKQNCAAARANLEQLNTGARKRVKGPDGELIYLTEEDRQARIANAQKQIEEFCSNP